MGLTTNYEDIERGGGAMEDGANRAEHKREGHRRRYLLRLIVIPKEKQDKPLRWKLSEIARPKIIVDILLGLCIR